MEKSRKHQEYRCKGIFDTFVLTVMLLNIIVSLGSNFVLPFVSNKVLYYGIASLSFLGGFIVFIRFISDFNYNLPQFLYGFCSHVLFVYIIFSIIDYFFNSNNIYYQIVISGLIISFSWAYFYQRFKKISYAKMEKKFKNS